MGKVDFYGNFLLSVVAGMSVALLCMVISNAIGIFFLDTVVVFEHGRISQRDGPSFKVDRIRCELLSTASPAPYRCYAPRVSFNDDIWVMDIHIRCDVHTTGVSAKNCTASYSTVSKNDEQMWKYSTRIANNPGLNDFWYAYFREGFGVASVCCFPIFGVLAFLAFWI